MKKNPSLANRFARAVIKGELERRFPRYTQLVDPQAVSLDEARALLSPGEVLVSSENYQHPVSRTKVANGERLIDKQYLGIHVNGHGECQPHNHSAGVGFHGLMDEVADLGERGDIGELAIHLPRGDAEDRGVQVNVFAA